MKDGDALAQALKVNAADPMAKAAAGGLRTAAICAGDGGKCVEAKRLWKAFSDAFTPGADQKFIDSGFKENVPACAKK